MTSSTQLMLANNEQLLALFKEILVGESPHAWANLSPAEKASFELYRNEMANL